MVWVWHTLQAAHEHAHTHTHRHTHRHTHSLNYVNGQQTHWGSGRSLCTVDRCLTSMKWSEGGQAKGWRKTGGEGGRVRGTGAGQQKISRKLDRKGDKKKERKTKYFRENEWQRSREDDRQGERPGMSWIIMPKILAKDTSSSPNPHNCCSVERPHRSRQCVDKFAFHVPG